MQHVHITGVSPRTGTTLMMELMVSCFEFDDCPIHEQSLLLAPNTGIDRFCSKNPGPDDLRFALAALKKNPDLWIIGMVRDPRDVVVSRHLQSPDEFWADLSAIKTRAKYLLNSNTHDRFIIVRYEDLVNNPDAVQDALIACIPFLEKRARFSDFSKIARPSANAKRALGGVRAISTNSIGRWRDELPRLKGQIARYGPIEELLRTLGYEQGEDWSTILQGVEPDMTESFWEGRRAKKTLIQNLIKDVESWRIRLWFLSGYPVKANGLLRKEAQKQP